MSANIIKNFTPAEFIALDKHRLDELLKNKIPFSVAENFKFDNGFYFSYLTENLHNQSGNVVELTKIQKKLLMRLIQNPNEIVSYETIAQEVWKGKNMSQFTLRNQIKSLRDKIYPEIIKNISNHGYIISSSKELECQAKEQQEK